MDQDTRAFSLEIIFMSTGVSDITLLLTEPPYAQSKANLGLETVGKANGVRAGSAILCRKRISVPTAFVRAGTYPLTR